MDKINNTQRELQKQYTPIMAFSSASRKPYIESFYYEPENIVQQPLGTLLGYFEVREYSEESAYIVNFLNSVLKKEYYINPRRSVGESLDAALHKVNVALSEIAKHGNVDWLGNLDAAICVLEKNSLHFSVSGEAKILLSRGDTFNEISDGLSSEIIEPHPLKTFVNVASGRLETKDRLIIASRDIFSLFTSQQLKKNNDRLDDNQFIQFLKTALVNNSNTTHVGVVLLSEKKLPPKNKKKEKLIISEEKSTNVFSQQAFVSPEQAESMADKKNTQTTEEKPEYIDSKTGHIYVKGEQQSEKSESYFSESISTIWENIADSLQHLKNKLRRKLIIARKSLHKSSIHTEKTIEELRPEKQIEQTPELKIKPEITKSHTTVLSEKIPAKIKSESTVHSEPKKEKKIISTPTEISAKIEPKTKLERPSFFENYKKQFSDVLKEKTPQLSESLMKKISNFVGMFFKTASNTVARLIGFIKNTLEKRKETQIKSSEKKEFKEKEQKFRLLPSLARLKNTFFSLNSKQKLWGLIAIAAIIILPMILAAITNKNNIPEQAQTTQAPSREDLLINEKNISFSTSLSSINTLTDIIFILPTENNTIFINKNSLFIDENQQQVPLPSSDIISAAYMKDLSLVFLLTSDNKIISFSPNTKQFKENSIEFPSGFKPKEIGTYLTYLYVTDANSNQIYRYPRAEGGFGTKTNWLKDTADISLVSDMTIDDSVYLAYSDKLIKFFKGKQDHLNFENSATPIVFSAIYTDTNQSSVYVLDKQNSRIIIFNKTNGQIKKQYYNESFTSATSIAANEKSNQIYIATPSKMQSIAIE